MKNWLRVLLLCCGGLALPVAADNNLFPWLELAEDPSRQLSLADIDQLSWQPTQGQVFNPGFSQSAYWLRGSVSLQQASVLLAAMPLLDYIDLWLLDAEGQVLQQFQTGDRLPFASRDLPRRNFAFALDAPLHQPLQLVIRMQSHDGLFDAVPLRLLPVAEYQNLVYQETFVYGLYYGALCLLLLYHLLLWLRHRDPDFRRYALYLAAFLLFSLSFRGYAAQWLWPNAPLWNNQIIPISVILLYAAIFHFSSGLLRTQDHFPLAHRLTTWVIYSLALPLALALTGHYAWCYWFLIPQSLLVLGFVLYLGVRSALAGVPSARIFILAWGVFLLSGMLYTLRVANWIPSSFWVEHAIDFGSTLENLLLALALAEKLNRLQRERNSAQAAALHAEQQLSQQLGRMVDERTQALQVAKAELEVLVQQDPLTGLHNRRAYETYWQRLLASPGSAPSSLALLVMDLDHFKVVNDHCGHAAGDAILQAFAELASHYWRKDGLFRLGGDEFAALVTGVSEAQLRQRLAEFIQAFSDLGLHNPSGHQQRQTLSIGAVLCQSPQGHLPHQWFDKADQALYQAKQQGRNAYSLVLAGQQAQVTPLT